MPRAPPPPMSGSNSLKVSRVTHQSPRRRTFELSGARRNATRRGNAAPRVRPSAGLGSDRIEGRIVESEAVHAGRILRLRAARNTNPARCRGAGRDGGMVLPGTHLAGAGSMTANATPVARDRPKRRRAARGELSTWHVADTRRGWKPAIWWNEARMPTGQVLQLSCGVTPNATAARRATERQPQRKRCLWAPARRCLELAGLKMLSAWSSARADLRGQTAPEAVALSDLGLIL